MAERRGLYELIEDVAGRRPGGEHWPLGEGGLGLNSLERIELVAFVEDEYEVIVSDENLQKARTVGDVRRLWIGGPSPR